MYFSDIIIPTLSVTGQVFYERGKRMFATDPGCDECVVIHNNWIVSAEAKKYRFKEFLMWDLDTDGYYSNASQKYLTYNNPFDFGAQETCTHELEALKIALRIGHLLDRVVILPSFHCYQCKYDACENQAKRCSLNTHVRMTVFDQYLDSRYREHMFLKHHKVPDEVKQSLSDIILVGSDMSVSKERNAEFRKIPVDVIFTPADGAKGAEPDVLKYWLAPYQNYAVLRFHSLYNSLKALPSDKNYDKFETILSKAIKTAGYQQY